MSNVRCNVIHHRRQLREEKGSPPIPTEECHREGVVTCPTSFEELREERAKERGRRKKKKKNRLENPDCSDGATEKQ
jgi:hypothetical protein